MAKLPAPGDPTSPPALTDALTSAAGYATEEKSIATRRAYRSDWRHFSGWCASMSASTLPAAAATVAAYLAALADAGLKASTISRRLVAITYGHRLKGLDPPTASEAVLAVLRGIRRRIGVAPTRKAPATAGAITAMLAHVPDTQARPHHPADRLRGALRRSELAALTVRGDHRIRLGGGRGRGLRCRGGNRDIRGLLGGWACRRGDAVAVLLLQFRACPIFRGLRGVAEHRGELVAVSLGDPPLDRVVVQRGCRRRGRLLVLAGLEDGFLQFGIAPVAFRIRAQELVGARYRGRVLLGTRRRRQHGRRAMFADLPVDRNRSLELLRCPPLLDSELAERFRQLGDVATDVLTFVAVPFHRPAQLSPAQAGTLESVAEGAPEQVVLGALKSELCVTVHGLQCRLRS
jgi:Phage integrase, N-terminal SAM-like domain